MRTVLDGSIIDDPPGEGLKRYGTAVSYTSAIKPPLEPFIPEMSNRFSYILIHINLNRPGKKCAPSLQVVVHDRIAGDFLTIEFECSIRCILDYLEELGLVIGVFSRRTCVSLKA